ncbi:hypothetical protein D3C72_2059770 [compost metagenome]
MRGLGIADPDIAVVVEQVLHHLGLEAELEFQLGVVQHLRLADRVVGVGRARRLIGVVGPERRQQVDRLVGA